MSPYRVGWIQDVQCHAGGAELSMAALKESCPGPVVDFDCTEPERAVDVWVVGNCTHFTADQLVPFLRTAPVVKRVADYWPNGDPVLREWLLQHSSKLIFSSPRHLVDFPYRTHPYGSRVMIVPPPIDLVPFRKARRCMPEADRKGTLWLAQASDPMLKGVPAALQWAARHNEVVDFYGDGTERIRSEWAKCHGPVPYSAVPALMARHKTFLFMPSYAEPFGRTVIEARAAGCRLIVNAVPGAVWYIEQGKDGEVETATDLFWEVVTDVVANSKRTKSVSV